ncbi:magnesium transporter NIPA-domain-containing protein [Chaetomium sp. MPI-SDFR-AT-0129]|nr:magnesium transporter NIPA-domain-containing protein [Chaetomium sp. MPI-SDFR-AT-0129]
MDNIPPAPRWSPASWLGGNNDGDGNGDEGDELQNWSSLIGIVTAICGNVLIALALNVQRYAHTRLHRKKAWARARARLALRGRHQNGDGSGSRNGNGAGPYGAGSNGYGSGEGNGTVGRYSDDSDDSDGSIRGSSETDPLARSPRAGSYDGYRDEDEDDDDENHDDSHDGINGHGNSKDKPKVASTYLQDPYWWLGQVLITVGEMGNFLAYGFAPASIVSPLGVVALVSNCVIAPIFFKERFRPRDFWGVIIAIGGAVTVVLSAKTEETKLGPHEVWGAITTMEFEIYLGVSCGLIVLLLWLSPRYGNRTILIDLGLVGLFGGYTVLSTKGVSSMLSSTLFGAFTTPVTYVLVFILLSTAILQVRYVNKALQRFDSTQVIPIQFVLFTLSVIIGSAVLYRDFERTTKEQAAKFIGGCLLTFFGVFLITSGRPRHDDGDGDEPTLSEVEGIEETIGLANQDRAPPPTPPRRRNPPSRSGGSSRASRVSFSDTVHEHDGYPTPRSAPSAPRRPLSHGPNDDDNDDNESEYHDDHDHPDAPLLSNPWQDTLSTPPSRPSPGLHTFSADSLISAIHIPSAAGASTTTLSYASPTDHHLELSSAAAAPTTTNPQPIPTASKTTPALPTLSNTAVLTPPSRVSLPLSTPGSIPHHHQRPAHDTRDGAREGREHRPTTPRAPASTSRLPPSHLYSPSPFSGTVSAVVGDTLRALAGGNFHFRHGHDGADENGAYHDGSRSEGEEGYRDTDDDDTRVGDGRERSGSGSGGLRGRARSLSQTLGLAGLFGGESSSSASAAGAGAGGSAGGSVGGNKNKSKRRGTGTGLRREGGGGGMFGGPLVRARSGSASEEGR